MNKIIRLMLFLVAISQQTNAQVLTSEFLFDLEINLNSSQVVGPVLNGVRKIYPIKDGIIRGEKINGKILSGGGDWGLILDSTTFKLDVRATIETDDRALIFITYFGFIHSDAKKFAMILAGRGSELSPEDYYFRTNPVFETSSEKYAWLNHTIAIGVGRFQKAGKLSYRIYAIK